MIVLLFEAISLTTVIEHVQNVAQSQKDPCTALAICDSKLFLQTQVKAFMDQHVYPAEEVRGRCPVMMVMLIQKFMAQLAASRDRWTIPPIVEVHLNSDAGT